MNNVLLERLLFTSTMIESFIIGLRNDIPEMSSEDVLQSLLSRLYAEQNIVERRIYDEVDYNINMNELHEICDDAKEAAKFRYNNLISGRDL